ncbi:phenylalanine--tRNA ligase subunit alpha [Anaerococcus hydrogenalis]|uniref:Phenylalanine--tRNA ligase alpha subunit n=1 Tax=Anaerococcus hydrogenalis TaxID=33029 RepID=A0A2N6UI61_9FIRM|nr:phenylalanine--tRNA ligase subunit alpha [Anaerococcus hydrogenalis]MBS5988258.1 phenylalanine--tRNA ligase subunit alpha [Anaerococcus hydrogenalis]MDK7694683.1 phenylalanine--tRNA ligase subunit alpha [Anaerococcus hydrogenalis]MDK7696763.1 phenylalanine--tRNA ligase subunit alpha [Anaerococcus hydrogenalis]MDK7707710.1 phenylalanine--tRNA ligase subunit alpha [Anaerococcus hydrogenalis]PMC81328.1 phenylalanine--tRNA ligase subunit alpha [Anaerococcus hydrogenalis]
MKEKLEALVKKASEAIEKSEDLKTLDDLRVKYLGKKGEITSLKKNISKLPNDQKPMAGKLINQTSSQVENKLEERKEEIKKILLEKKVKEEKIDVTANFDLYSSGHLSVINQTMAELEEIFQNMGFDVVEGPEIDTVKNVFDDLNSPKNHPSRSLSDTFYINENTLLRPHTSSMQIRVMNEGKLPIKMVSAGRVFRNDEVDATHSPMFHQLECLVVDENVSLANLKATLETFIKEMFGDEMKMRYRPHHFPFTEPSLEVDVTCPICGGKGCPACSNTGWSMELLGGGMVHPNVLENCGIDSEKYTGFAFGLGVDRIAMVKYGLDDIRLLFDNDKRFIEQF